MILPVISIAVRLFLDSETWSRWGWEEGLIADVGLCLGERKMLNFIEPRGNPKTIPTEDNKRLLRCPTYSNFAKIPW